MKGLNKNIIVAIAAMIGIFIMFPAVGAEELKVAQDFQYPTTHEGLKADWDYYTPSDSLGFGIWNDLFQSYHLGQDTSIYLTLTDKKIYAAADGIVRISDNKNWGGYGNYDAKTKKQGKGYAVVIEHKLLDGTYITSLYGHIQPGSTLYNEENEVGLIPVGTTVKKGQYIAKVADYLLKNGNNWHHLHFGIRKGQYTTGHDADYVAGYSLTGWTEKYTVHDTWYNPGAFVLDRLPTSITLTSPVGGEMVETGSELNVQWTYVKDPGDHVDVELLKDGVAVEGIGVRVLTDTKSAVLSIPKIIVLGGGYQIRIIGVKDGVRTEYADTSDEFTIYGQQIIVDSPNGGENWPKPSLQTIRWKYNGNPGSFVNIELLKGADVIPLTPMMVPIGINGEGSYTVSVTQTDGADYKIRISTDRSYTESNQWLSDTSDGYFSIGTNVCSAYSMSSSSSLKTSAISIDPCNPPPPPLNKKLDLVIMSDTTGSMGDDIAQVKASANEIVNALDTEGLDYRVAIADYKDYPVSPYGDPSDYVYKLDLPFTGKDNKQGIIDAINGLSVSGGNDEPESVYTALVHVMQDPAKDSTNSANSGWRNGVTKAIIIMGDAPPHIPEPWVDSHTLADVIYTSEHIDPVIVYSVAVGTSVPAFDAFSDISNGTNGKVYSSPTAADIVATIIEVIGDIGQTPESRGVLLNVTPTVNKTVPGKSATYTVNITNTGNVIDTYNLTLEPKSFRSFQKAYPTTIQPAWVTFSSVQVTLNPNASVNKLLTIAIPPNWAGMEDVTYGFNVTAASITNVSIGNTSSAELMVKADKRSMAEYSKLEIQWLMKMVQHANIANEGVKNALLAKLANAESQIDTAIMNIGNESMVNESLNTSQNVVAAFSNQVEAQYDKKVMQPDAGQLEEKANQILADLETAKNN